MNSNNTKVVADRRPWEAPRVVRMDAGAAENGAGVLADGGGPGASRS
jgi:hypothetical protein